MFKQFVAIFLRGFIYSIVFLAVFFIAYGFVAGPPGTKTVRSSDPDPRIEKQWQTAVEQQKKTEALLERSAEYYSRMEAIATKQEELTKRAEAIIEKWELQGVPRKVRP